MKQKKSSRGNISQDVSKVLKLANKKANTILRKHMMTGRQEPYIFSLCNRREYTEDIIIFGVSPVLPRKF